MNKKKIIFYIITVSLLLISSIGIYCSYDIMQSEKKKPNFSNNNILYDVLEVIDNDFLVNDIFNSDDEIIIKNLQKIRDDFEKVLNKYNVFKINFGIFSI